MAHALEVFSQTLALDFLFLVIFSSRVSMSCLMPVVHSWALLPRLRLVGMLQYDKEAFIVRPTDSNMVCQDS